jgi:hypothetical protein
MAFSFEKILSNRTGQILVSIILGFGLSTLFRKVCNGRNCIIIHGPKPNELNNNIYKIDNECYKYKTLVTKCSKNNIKIKDN